MSEESLSGVGGGDTRDVPHFYKRNASPLIVKTDCPPFKFSRVARKARRHRAGSAERAQRAPAAAPRGELGLLRCCRSDHLPPPRAPRSRGKPPPSWRLSASLEGNSPPGKSLSPGRPSAHFLTRGASSDRPPGCGRFSCCARAALLHPSPPPSRGPQTLPWAAGPAWRGLERRGVRSPSGLPGARRGAQGWPDPGARRRRRTITPPARRGGGGDLGEREQRLYL